MSDSHDRVQDLLVQRATEGLGYGEERELDALLLQNPEWDDDGFDLAAAAIQLALTEPTEMPDSLRQRISTQASDIERAPQRIVPVRKRTPSPWRRGSTWMAMAASLAIAVLGWVALRPSVESTPTQQRTELLASADDLITLEWATTDDASAVGASGDVVWSPSKQTGFMRFRGLAPNDPQVSQYQLWVFDAERDDRYPVDGGVFDIAAGETEIVVPIDVKLPVDQVSLFAVTVEEPGGVVVSSRERIAVLAQI